MASAAAPERPPASELLYWSDAKRSAGKQLVETQHRVQLAVRTLEPLPAQIAAARAELARVQPPRPARRRLTYEGVSLHIPSMRHSLCV